MVQCIFVAFNRSLTETLGGLVQNEAFDCLEDRKVLRSVPRPVFDTKVILIPAGMDNRIPRNKITIIKPNAGVHRKISFGERISYL
jgi:hypothetical protein